MKITSIKQQVKRPDRYSVFIEGKYSFSLSESALLESKIASGQEIDAAQLNAYTKLSADDKAYGNALRYAVMRARSEWEMRTYLRRKAVEEPTADVIVERLRGIGLLDDTAFARTWIENRRLLKPTSHRKLQVELKQKRVPEDVIRQVMEAEPDDDRTALREIAAKKRLLPRFRDDPTKLMQYLARQGFGYDDIKNVLAED